MKVEVASYFSMKSETGYDNYGLKLKFNILIIFPETFYLGPDEIDSLELMLEGRLRGLGLENPFAKKEEVRNIIEKVLSALDYEYESVFIDQSIR